MISSLNPTRRLLLAIAVLLAGGLLLGTAQALDAGLGRHWHALWWGALLALLAIALLDALRLQRQVPPQLSRSLPGRLALGRWSEVELQLSNSQAYPLLLELHDHVPDGLEGAGLPQRLALATGSGALLRYPIRALRRGCLRFEHCELWLHSALGFWRSRRLLPLAGETRVYPDFTRLQGASLRGIDDWFARLGVHRQPRRGLGLEFHQLREYREGDTLRQIDWKATARMHAPIAREYQDDRDQQVLLVLDCGRRMHSQEDHLSHFDHALNASLLLAHAALRQGDAVGLCTFASDAPRYIAPAKGSRQLGVLLDGIYDATCSLRPADYGEAVDRLLARQKRRALVVIISNLRDEDDDALQPALARLATRHRVLLASLREELLDELCKRPVERLDEALDYCGARDYLAARQELLARLQARQLPVVEARPAELGPALVQRYLAMKGSGSL